MNTQCLSSISALIDASHALIMDTFGKFSGKGAGRSLLKHLMKTLSQLVAGVDRVVQHIDAVGFEHKYWVE